MPSWASAYGVEMIHPRWQGRSQEQAGKKGMSNLGWVAGAKVCFVLNQFGPAVDWDVDTTDVADKTFHPLIAQFGLEAPLDRQMLVRTDASFHTRAKKGQPGDPANMEVCARHLERPESH